MHALKRYSRFESYREFEVFEAALAQQLIAGQLVPVPQPQVAGPFLRYRPDAWYQLLDSSELWALSTPDNAWRGYFLPAEEAAIYQRKLRRRDRRIRLVGLLIAGLLCFITWRLIK